MYFASRGENNIQQNNRRIKEKYQSRSILLPQPINGIKPEPGRVMNALLADV